MGIREKNHIKPNKKYKNIKPNKNNKTQNEKVIVKKIMLEKVLEAEKILRKTQDQQRRIRNKMKEGIG